MTTVKIEGLPYPCRTVSARRRLDLKREIETLHTDGKLADIVYRKYGWTRHGSSAWSDVWNASVSARKTRHMLNGSKKMKLFPKRKRSSCGRVLPKIPCRDRYVINWIEWGWFASLGWRNALKCSPVSWPSSFNCPVPDFVLSLFKSKKRALGYICLAPSWISQTRMEWTIERLEEMKSKNKKWKIKNEKWKTGVTHFVRFVDACGRKNRVYLPYFKEIFNFVSR